jgi:hypothetical protein
LVWQMTMRIQYLRSGGFAGLLRGCSIDVATLAPAAAVLVKGLVRVAQRVKVKTAKTPGAADLPVHEVTIETDAGALHLSFDDLALPKALKPLIAFLGRRSKPLTRLPG